MALHPDVQSLFAGIGLDAAGEPRLGERAPERWAERLAVLDPEEKRTLAKELIAVAIGHIRRRDDRSKALLHQLCELVARLLADSAVATDQFERVTSPQQARPGQRPS